MKITYRAGVIGSLAMLAAAAIASVGLAAEPSASTPLEIAHLTTDGKLQKPADLDRTGSFSAPRSAWATTRARSTPRSPGSSRSS